MDREIVDIPEVFRRAFDEDNGWRDGEGEDDNGGGQGGGGGGGGGTRTWWTSRWVWIALLILVLLLSFNWIVSTYTDWLWFSAQEYRDVWLTQWAIRILSFVIFFIIAAAVLLVNWRLAFNAAKRHKTLARLSLFDLPGVSWLITGFSLFIAFVFAGAGSSQWEKFLLYANRQPFGADDPIFHLDLGFYLFELPVYRLLQGWFTPLLVVTLIGVVAIYLSDNWVAIQRGQWRPVLPSGMRRHAAILATIIFALWAVGLWLDIYGLLYSTRGVAFGASYTDLKASLPGLYVQLALMILLVIITAINIFRPALRPFLITAGLWLVATIALGIIYPSVLQRYVVEPNELSRERPYIQHNINFTRLAFGLNRIDAREFGSVGEISNQDLIDNADTLRNARLWDYRPLQQTYAQLQELRPYYEFSSIDIDRYEIDGETRQVMLAGRELNKEDLISPSWVNQKLEFTHGYGVVMNPVDEVTPEGRPNFFIKDLPPDSSVDIEVDRPEIYYGEMMNDYVFVGSGLEEFDYPSGSKNAYSSYTGQGGVELNSIWRRLAFAVRYGEANLLLSDYITPETRILLNRQIRERVKTITPFLALDNDPYIVVADGRLIWMLDAYTLSRNFPYSEPSGLGFNYIRNAVKITVDAYDGTVTYYLADPDDPIIQTYAQAFPDLFHPLEEMPAELQAHIRYPEDLFSVQTDQYLRYHMSDVQVFYNQEDKWDIPLEVFDNNEQPMEPYYVILSLPDEEDTEFLLIQPYTPAGKDNMISWLAARSDPPNYGDLVVYELPKQELVFGPSQIESRIDQDPEISAQISLWNQRGSRVIRGNLIVMPMNDSFLYVEPLYLLAETSELPELQRVIVASGNRLAMEETLEEALIALIEMGPGDDDIVIEPPVGEGDEGTTAGEQPDESAAPVVPAPGAITSDPVIQELIELANTHFEAAEDAQRNGDWSAYGRELDALQQVLEQLMELTQE
jgi:uncharacterized membrane protein (UPF0182 family)